MAQKGEAGEAVGQGAQLEAVVAAEEGEAAQLDDAPLELEDGGVALVAGEGHRAAARRRRLQ